MVELRTAAARSASCRRHFHDAGYQTAITGKWHLGHGYKKFLPRARGFDHTYGHVNGAIDYFTHERDGGLDWNRDGVSVREEGYSTFLLGAETIRLIKQRDKARPFFHYLPFNAPHAPLQAPPEYIDRYANIKDEKRRRYAAMTEAMDATVGKVLAALDEEGIADNTLVLFFSDNGGPTGPGRDQHAAARRQGDGVRGRYPRAGDPALARTSEARIELAAGDDDDGLLPDARGSGRREARKQAAAGR